jgi:hypothetical protein
MVEQNGSRFKDETWISFLVLNMGLVVKFKEYHIGHDEDKCWILKWCVKPFSSTSLYSFLIGVTITTQNKVLTKVILKFIAL